MSTKKAKSPAKHRTTVLVPQPHGGAIRVGGKPGNAGGSGRPAETIRASMRESLDNLLPGVLEDYREGKLDKVRVVEFLARYGLGTKDEVSIADHPEFKKRVEALRDALVEIIGEDIAAKVLLRGHEIFISGHK